MLDKYKNRKKYLHKKSKIEQRLSYDVMEDGVAYIPCKVKGIEDIISRFSIKGYESLESEFLLFIIDFAEYVPPEYPVMLEIYGPKFTEEEKKTIRETIESDFDYMLGRTMRINTVRRKRFFGMIIGTILSGAILIGSRMVFGEVPLEFIYVFYWLFADAFVRYIFIDKLDYSDDQVYMGRLASMKVEFNEISDQS